MPIFDVCSSELLEVSQRPRSSPLPLLVLVLLLSACCIQRYRGSARNQSTLFLLHHPTRPLVFGSKGCVKIQRFTPGPNPRVNGISSSSRCNNMENSGRTSPTVALVESQNILPEEKADATGSHVVKAYAHQRCDAFVLSTSTCGGDVSAEEVRDMTAAKDTMFATPGKRAGVAASPAKDPGPAAPLKDSGVPVREEGYVSGEAFTLAEDGSPSAHDSEREGPALSDPDDESLALARQLLEEEALASYAASVDLLRGADPETVSAATGVGAEDMALMQAIMEEDASAQDAFALAEDESLDYEGMLELGTAIGDVRKERWRTRCKGVIESLPRFRYAAEESSAGDDTKCLVCQCEFEDGDDLRRLPCSHAFHTDCVDGWLEENEECPTCRRSVQAPPTR